MDQVVADRRPSRARVGVADVMAHADGLRREDREVGAALALDAQLRAFQAGADLVVRDDGRGKNAAASVAAGARGDLQLAIVVELGRGRGVVAVAIDDHGVPSRWSLAAVGAVVSVGALRPGCGSRR